MKTLLASLLLSFYAHAPECTHSPIPGMDTPVSVLLAQDCNFFGAPVALALHGVYTLIAYSL